MSDIPALRARADAAQREYLSDLARIEHLKAELAAAQAALASLGASSLAAADLLRDALAAHLATETADIEALLDGTAS